MYRCFSQILEVLAWAYVYNKHDTWEQFYIYSICTPLGSQMLYLIKKNSSEKVALD
uniref:Uncharacterized protein n=1 Tax=Helianthus annuus TaxID=4232 RepID=A0A251VMV8_HELAN